ncbi:MAG TPA: pantoate--beta-alanine ligase [Myxococcaceae bacterium]|nr:pantoate--beta-alanine ligase [Myxococcaceae bacterium]
MRVVRSPAELSAWTEAERRDGRRVGLVPTMGFLHAGHLSLIAGARARTDRTAVSIFVNPTQFGPNEDFARYPRDLDGDLAKCRSAGVDLVFAPDAGAMYPPGHRTFVEVTGLQDGLCGARRPGHFRGVATIVAQLFALARPHLAVFGEKDWQQLQIIRRLSTDLHLGVDVVGMPIVREPDGLAMSSRNAYLSAAERARAVALSSGLRAARARWTAGERDAGTLREAVRAELRRAEVREDYVELVEPETLEPLVRAERPDSRLLVAGFLGATRLIDNTAVGC